MRWITAQNAHLLQTLCVSARSQFVCHRNRYYRRILYSNILFAFIFIFILAYIFKLVFLEMLEVIFMINMAIVHWPFFKESIRNISSRCVKEKIFIKEWRGEAHGWHKKFVENIHYHTESRSIKVPKFFEGSLVFSLHECFDNNYGTEENDANTLCPCEILFAQQDIHRTKGNWNIAIESVWREKKWSLKTPSRMIHWPDYLEHFSNKCVNIVQMCWEKDDR